VFAVYERDGWAQTDAFAAYGVCNLPLTPGFHDVEAHCWRANNRNARMSEEIAALFAGARAELDGWKRCVIRREELYASPAVTVGMGSVHLQVNVLAKNLDISGLHVGGVSASAAADKARRAALRARAGLAASPGGKENDPTDSPMSSPRNWPGSPTQASGVASVRRRVQGEEPSGGEPLQSSHRRAGRFSAPGGAGVTPDSQVPPRRSFRSSVSAVSAATDAFGAGGRRARGVGGVASYGGGVASSALSERRAERTSSGAASGYGPPVGGGVGASGYGGGGVGSFAHQREQIEDEPLNQPGGRRSRAFARGGGY
jgi:B9 domain-containing protein 2